MKSNLALISSVLFLSAGLSLIIGYCHGTAGLNFGLPLSGSSLHVNIVTAGAPALGGFALTIVGALLLIAAFFIVIASPFIPKKSTAKAPENPPA